MADELGEGERPPAETTHGSRARPSAEGHGRALGGPAQRLAVARPDDVRPRAVLEERAGLADREQAERADLEFRVTDGGEARLQALVADEVAHQTPTACLPVRHSWTNACTSVGRLDRWKMPWSVALAPDRSASLRRVSQAASRVFASRTGSGRFVSV